MTYDPTYSRSARSNTAVTVSPRRQGPARIGSLFSGFGGLDLAVLQALPRAEVAWHSEVMPAACKVLARRWPDVPNLGDITAVDWSTVEPVDILTGGFPCQDVSAAGKRLGIHPDTRSGLWTHMAYAIDRLRPPLVIVENVWGLLSARAHSDVEPCPWCLGDGEDKPHLRALGAVLADLAGIGYDAEWVGLPASDVGAPHGRFRIFIVASDTRGGGRGGAPAANPDEQGPQRTESAAGPVLPARSLAADTEHKGRNESAVARGAGPSENARRMLKPRGPRLDPPTATAHPPGDGRHEGWPEPARIVGRSDAAVSGAVAVTWGQYAPAIHRWARVLGRPAPPPTVTGPKGGQALSAALVEWMMGLPAGWVTDCGLTRAEALTVLGGGVVPQQAVEALRRLGVSEWVAA